MANLSPYVVARHLSQVLNPLTVMAFVIAWVIFLRVDSIARALGLWAVCVVFGAILPLSYVLWLRHRGDIPELFIPDQHKRQRPLGWTVVCYGCGVGALWLLDAPMDVLAVMVCCAGLAFLMFGMTPFIKISLHAAGIWSGFAVALFWGGSVLLLVVPLAVSWARVVLGAHTRMQVILGGVLGLGVTWSILYGLVDQIG